MNEAAQGSAARSRVLPWVIVILLVFSVPWYFPAGDGGPFVWGVPLWCFVSFACCCAIALIVAIRLPALWDEQGVERDS